MEFTPEEIQIVIESLRYTKLKFEEYQHYPSYEYKQQRIHELSQLIEKLRKSKKEMQHAN